MIVTQPASSQTSQLTVDSDLDMLTLYQVKNLASPAATEALRKGSTDIANAEVNAAAAIAYTKLALTGNIVNADVNAAAAIARSKLDFGAGLVNADIAAAAAIAYSKLALTGNIVNADIAAGAAIALSKLATTPTVGAVGSYSGNDTANRAITHGLGVAPKLVCIVDSNSYFCCIIQGLAKIFGISGGTSSSLAVTAVTSTYFYVGNATNYARSANDSIQGTWYWAAIG